MKWATVQEQALSVVHSLSASVIPNRMKVEVDWLIREQRAWSENQSGWVVELTTLQVSWC